MEHTHTQGHHLHHAIYYFICNNIIIYNFVNCQIYLARDSNVYVCASPNKMIKTLSFLLIFSFHGEQLIKIKMSTCMPNEKECIYRIPLPLLTQKGDNTKSELIINLNLKISYQISTMSVAEVEEEMKE